MSAITMEKIIRIIREFKKPTNDFYKIDALSRNSERYELNYRAMLRAVKSKDWEKHKELIKIERELNSYDIELRKDLGIMIPNPCGKGTCKPNGCIHYDNGFCKSLRIRIIKEDKKENEEKEGEIC